MSTPVEIQVDNLYKVFGKQNKKKALKLAQENVSKVELLKKTGCVLALQDINLKINKGETFAVIGLSGCGKSTLIRHINRLLDPDSGTITIQGQNILELKQKDLLKYRQNKISMVFQHFALLPHWNVEDNVAYGLFIKHKSKAEAKQAVAPWLKKVGLYEYRDKYPDQLSGGMLQRVGLARAFSVDADIILMDEPFSALDPIIRKNMQKLLNSWQSELNKTIVFITHDIDEAFSLGDKIAVLRASRVEQVGTSEELIDNPQTEYVERFVSAGYKGMNNEA